MGLNGTFFDAQHAKQPTTTPATFALRDTKGKDAQFHLSQYTINTGLKSGFSTGLDLDITYLLSHYLNVNLTTDVLGTIIPEVLTKYGPGHNVGVSGQWVSGPASAEFTQGLMDFKACLKVTVTIQNETAIEAMFESIYGNFGLHSQDGEIFGKINNATVGLVGAEFKNTLNLTGEELRAMLQKQVDDGVDQANQLL